MANLESLPSDGEPQTPNANNIGMHHYADENKPAADLGNLAIQAPTAAETVALREAGKPVIYGQKVSQSPVAEAGGTGLEHPQAS